MAHLKTQVTKIEIPANETLKRESKSIHYLILGDGEITINIGEHNYLAIQKLIDENSKQNTSAGQNKTK